MNFSHIFLLPPGSDWLYLLLLSFVILILIAVSEIARKYLHWPQEATRKLVHISVGILLLLTPLLLETALPLLTIALFFTIFNFIALRKNLLPGIHIEPDNLGTVYYAFSFFLLILIFWQDFKIVIIASMMIMAVGDASAAIVGKMVKNPIVYILVRDKKTLQGSLTMFLVSSMVVFATFILYPTFLSEVEGSIFIFIMVAIATAIVATAAEALGDKGNDNLTVPLLSAIVLYFLLNNGREIQIQFFMGIVMGGMVTLLSYRAKFLSASGSVAAFLLATIIFGFGGWQWTVPILTFFILSSFLSKLGKLKYDSLFEKGSQRDHVQVLANGGIAGILMIIEVLYPNPFNYPVYLGSLAAATADTWATEIGMRWGKQPRLISNFKSVLPGISGGVTLAGLLGALIGSLILILSGILFIPSFLNLSGWLLVFLLTVSGFLGSLIDSLLGATLQVQYQCPVCHKQTEKKIHCDKKPTVMVSGISWLNNDVVNFFNTITGALFTALIIRLF
jgi:uncharacterized protein (TIGR00297 family)